MLTGRKTAVIVTADGFDVTARCQPVLNATRNDFPVQAMELTSDGPIPRQEETRPNQVH